MRSLFCSATICTLLLLSLGCSQSVESRVQNLNDSHIKQLTNLYFGYQRSHGWQGPKDAAALKDFVKHDMDPTKLEMMKVKVDKLDDLFVSQRDHKPFKIKYSMGGGPGASVAVVFEDTGIEGKRQVGLTGPRIQEVDDAQYDELWNGRSTKGPDASAPASSNLPSSK
jgi:hypothetical protein